MILISIWITSIYLLLYQYNMVKSDYKYISWKELIKLLDRYYWIEILSQKWSHIKIKLNNNWIKTIIPNHKELAYWTFSSILEQLKIDENTFLKQIK